MQPYIYGAANPVRFSDPSGLCPYAGCWEAFDAWLGGYAETKESGRSDVTWNGLAESRSRHSYGSQGKTNYPDPRPELPRVPLSLDWANCLTQGTLTSCGTPSVPGGDRDGDGDTGLGLHSYHQAWWCLTRANDCDAAAYSPWVVDDQLFKWRATGDFSENELNGMRHALWMALQTDGNMSDADARALGMAHEMDKRNGYVDTGRDLLNNEVGIAIGNDHFGYLEVVGAVEQALASGLLWCINVGGSGPAVTSC